MKTTDLRTAAQQALWALEYHVEMTWPIDRTSEAIFNLRAALAQPQIDPVDEYRKGFIAGQIDMRDREPPAPETVAVQEQDIEDAIEAAYWHFDARKKGLNEWASAPQSERDAFKAEARKLVRGYFPTRQAQDTKREMLAVADAFIRGKRAAPPQRKPLSLTDLQEALVLTNLIDRDAIDDSEEYDEGSTLAQIDELYRIIKEDKA